MGDVARYVPGVDLRPSYDEYLYTRDHPTEDDNVYPIVLVCLGEDGQARIIGMVGQDAHPSTPAGRGALYPFDRASALDLVWRPESDAAPIYLTQGGAPAGMMPWGIAGLGLSKQSDTGIYVAPGRMLIDGVWYTVSATLTKALTGLGNDTWYFAYLKPPASGYALSAAEVEYSTTVPSFDVATLAWWHPSNPTWRCRGYFRTNGSAAVLPFNYDNGWMLLQDTYWSLWTTSPAITFTATTLDLPNLGVKQLVLLKGFAQNTGNEEGAAVREVGSSETGQDKTRLCYAGAGLPGYGERFITANASRQIEYTVYQSSNSTAGLAAVAIRLPQGMR